ncbi:MAG: hypothetical protein KC502_21710, partial [Myxococcales bacterium]|nr:hypothetical protein [Myxococcales bacterium]
TSGYLRLEGAHDRLYKLMGDDEARDAAADRAANAARAAQERAEQEERDDRRRRGFRTTRDTPQPMPSLEEDVDATVMTSVSADDIRAALAAAGHVEVDNASLKDTIPPTPRASLSQLEEVLKEHTDAIADAISEANPNGTADGQDWDMPTMQVTAGDLAAALKERGFE